MRARIAWWRDYTSRNGAELNNYPSHGNKEGGAVVEPAFPGDVADQRAGDERSDAPHATDDHRADAQATEPGDAYANRGCEGRAAIADSLRRSISSFAKVAQHERHDHGDQRDERTDLVILALPDELLELTSGVSYLDVSHADLSDAGDYRAR